jgi:succinate-acetate transporter protein
VSSESRGDVFLRPIGNPLPLAFFALAIGTLSLSSLQLGWIPTSEGDDVALVMVAFVFPLQFVAAVLAFLARDGPVGAAIGLIAGSWLVIGLVTLTAPPAATSDALGIFLLALALQLTAPVLSSLSSKTVAAAIVGGAAIRFAVTAVFELTGSGTWEDVAGIVGVALFVLAFYGGLGFELADARQGRGPLPVGRNGGDPGFGSEPAGTVDREAGVRPLL